MASSIDRADEYLGWATPDLYRSLVDGELPRVEIKISFKGDHWYWLDVIPLRPGRHVLTCWVRKVWDATFRFFQL